MSLAAISARAKDDPLRAGVWQGDASIILENRAAPVAREGREVVLVEGCGICIADAESALESGGPQHRPPMVLGHEIVGRLTAAASDAPATIRDLSAGASWSTTLVRAACASPAGKPLGGFVDRLTTDTSPTRLRAGELGWICRGRDSRRRNFTRRDR